ncbi:hypothetical protein B0H14DRAFT_3480934 [Mycena olivaceomarginata]|nr:hypothetical protein B0H14DRAFT_3480934 [Mycena olivaceomarginata]
MHSEAPHRVWASWNHPASNALSEYLIGTKLLEDDTAVRKALLDALPILWPSPAISLCVLHHTGRTVPLDFLSFIAAINDIFYFLDVVPQTWTRYLFDPSDEEADKLLVLPLDFQIPELDYPNFTKVARDWSMDPHYSIRDAAPAAADRKPDYSLFATPAPSPQKRPFTRIKGPSGMASGVGPASGSTLLSVPAEKAVPPRETLLETMVKAELMYPRASTSSNVEVVVPHVHDLSSDMPATPQTRSRRNIAPPPSKDLPADPRCPAKRKASNESTSAKKKRKGAAGKRAKSEATVHDVSDDEAEEAADTKPKAGARSNIIVVPRCKNAAQSQKLELNDVVDTDRLSKQIVEYLNERVKKGAPRDSKVDLDFHDLDENLPWTDQSAYLWGLRIRGTPVHFYSHLMPYSGARKTTEGYKSRFEAIPKIPSAIVEEVDFSEAGIQRDIKGAKNCEHAHMMEELIQFYCEISEKYAMTSDVTEMLLKNLRDAPPPHGWPCQAVRGEP